MPARPPFVEPEHAADGAAPPLRLVVGGVPKAALLHRLTDSGVQLNPLAEALFADPRFTTAAQPRALDLAAVRVVELGFADGTCWADLLAAAAARGLEPGPLELAPQLRLAWGAQPEGARGQPMTTHRAPPGALTVVSAPLPACDDESWGFYLRRIDGRLWLRGYRSWAGHPWAPDDRLLFCRAPV